MPTLKYVSLDETPEELRPFAKKADENSEEIIVNVVPQETLNEFRETNIKVLKERDELKTINSRLTSIVGEDPESFEKNYTELQNIHRRVKDGELSETTDIEEALAKRTSTMVESYEEQLRKEKGETNAWRETAAKREQALKQNQIDRVVTDAVLSPKSGARPDALPDILTRAYDVFRVEDGKVIPKNGDATIYGSDGASPMSAVEWLTTELKPRAGYMFKDSSGGGAGGTGENLPGGMSKEDLSKMSPLQRLEYANKENGM